MIDLRGSRTRLIYGLTFGRSFLWNLVFFFLPLLLIDRGLSAGWRGVLLATMSASGVLFALFSGVLADRLSPRPVVGLGLLLTSLFFLLLATAQAPGLLFIAFLFGGLGGHLAQLGSEAYVYKLVAPDKNASGLAGLVTAYVVAMALGLVVGGLMLRTDAAQALCFGGAAGTLLLVAWVPKLWKLPPAKLDVSSYLKDARLPGARALLLICVLTRLHWGTELTCYAPFLEQSLGLDRLWVGLFMAGPIALFGMSSFLGGRVLDRRPGQLLLVVGLLASGVGHIGFAASSGVVAALAWRVVHELGEAIVIVGVFRTLGRLFPSERSGGSVGLVGLVSASAAAIGALMSVYVGEWFSLAAAHWLTGAAILAALPLVGSLWREPAAPKVVVFDRNLERS